MVFPPLAGVLPFKGPPQDLHCFILHAHTWLFFYLVWFGGPHQVYPGLTSGCVLPMVPSPQPAPHIPSGCNLRNASCWTRPSSSEPHPQPSSCSPPPHAWPALPGFQGTSEQGIWEMRPRNPGPEWVPGMLMRKLRFCEGVCERPESHIQASAPTESGGVDASPQVLGW